VEYDDDDQPIFLEPFNTNISLFYDNLCFL